MQLSKKAAEQITPKTLCKRPNFNTEKKNLERPNEEGTNNSCQIERVYSVHESLNPSNIF